MRKPKYAFPKRSNGTKEIPFKTEIPGIEEWCVSVLADGRGVDIAMTNLSGSHWLISRFDTQGRLVRGENGAHPLTTMEEILPFLVHRANQVVDGNVGFNTTYESFSEKSVEDFQGYRGLKEFWEGVVGNARNHMTVWSVLNK